MSASSRLVLRLEIVGAVQGVGYRAWMQREARRRGVVGWVRNRPDGSVQALVAGEREAVEAVVAACRHGPLRASVDKVENFLADESDVPPGETRFVTRRDR